jgi:hypothetical protein
MSKIDCNIFPELTQEQRLLRPAVEPDLSALIAEGVTPAELADLVAVANADPRANRIINDNTHDAESGRRFVYRLWLLRRALAQIDWSTAAVIRNDASSDPPPK